MVLALNTVCDVYFAGSIDLLCDAWDLTPDVAGATWLQKWLQNSSFKHEGHEGYILILWAKLPI